MRLAPIQEEGRGGRRSSMPRSAHPSAIVFGFGTAKHEERGKSESFLSIGAEVCPAQRSSQAAKAAERWLGGGAAFGRLQLHGVMVAAHRSLRIIRQSRQPPFRCEAGTGRTLCSLEGSRWAGEDTSDAVSHGQAPAPCFVGSIAPRSSDPCLLRRSNCSRRWETVRLVSLIGCRNSGA